MNFESGSILLMLIKVCF